MAALVSALIPIIVVVVIAVIIVAVSDRFAPDPLIATIVKWVVYAVVLIVLLTKLVPLLGI